MKTLTLTQAVNQVLVHPPHEEILYHRDEIIDLDSSEFEESIGEPVGQLADYRIPLKDGRSIHLRIYDKLIGIHWDKIHPHTIEDGIEHLRRDSPVNYTAFCTAGGAGLGTLVSKYLSRKDIATKLILGGALLGLLFGLATAEW